MMKNCDLKSVEGENKHLSAETHLSWFKHFLTPENDLRAVTVYYRFGT